MINTIRSSIFGFPTTFKTNGKRDYFTIPTTLTQQFSNWQTSNLPIFTHFRSHLDTIIQHFPLPDNIIAHADKIRYIISELPLKGISKYISMQLDNITISKLSHPNDPLFSTILPCLLNSNTFKALTLPPRTNRFFRFSPHAFRTTALRKLRLPLKHISSYKTCPCGKELDPFGDHFFGCLKFSKTQAHNKIRDCIQGILQELCPIIQHVNNKHDIIREQNNLLPSNPSRRPGDVVINLNHTANTTASKVLIDVRLASPIKSAPQPLQMCSNIMTQVVFRHLSAHEIDKLRGPNRTPANNTHGSEVIAECLALNYQLTPFIVDPFGLLGPTATDFLLGPDTPASQFQIDIDRFHESPTKQAIKSLYDNNRISDIFRKADTNWSHNKQNHIWFTDSYKATIPSVWARYILSCGISKALAAHIDASFSVLRKHHHQSSTSNHINFQRYCSDSF